LFVVTGSSFLTLLRWVALGTWGMCSMVISSPCPLTESPFIPAHSEMGGDMGDMSPTAFLYAGEEDPEFVEGAFLMRA
jgi:hypothetical protein